MLLHCRDTDKPEPQGGSVGRVLATPPPIAHHVMLMEDFEPEPAFSSETPRDSLSGKTARGFIWMLGQTVGSKLFSFGTQIALARLLLPRDFGLETHVDH